MKKILSKKDLKKFLDIESKKYGLKSSKYPIIAINEDKILYRINYMLRKLEYYSNTNRKIMKIITKIIYTKLTKKYMISIPINVFDDGLKLIHLGPRLVNGKVTVGKNCTLHTNTFIVAGGTNDDVPTIGDNVIMGVNSVVLGNAKIGNNVAIGAGAVVNKDFSEGNMTIAGVPAKKISSNTRDSWSKENRRSRHAKD